MRGDTKSERCSVCNGEMHQDGQRGYEPLAVDEDNKEFVFEHCPHCGTLIVSVETIPAHSR